MSDVRDQVERAVAAARAALEAWLCAPHARRVEVLTAFAEQLRRRKADLTETISREIGKPRWESATEVDAMINKVALSIRAHEERRRDIRSESAGVISATRYKPHGVLAVLGPFNFPGHLPNGHIVPAVLAGNTVVFKPSEFAPATADVTLECWRAAGLPENVITIAQGGSKVGEALVSHHGIDGVLFTGSFAAGRAINRALADHPGKITALEMGGNNPLVVHKVADLTAAAYATLQSAYLTAGQRCSCARRLILIAGPECVAFVNALLRMIGRLRVGLYTDDPEPFMGPVINAAAAEKLLAAQAELVRRNAQPLVELRPLRGILNLLMPGLIDVTDVADRPDEELFGPILQLVRVKDFDAAIEEANKTRFGLAAGLLSDDRSLYEQFFRRVKAGVINWNRPLTGASSSLPFGGIGDSGNHRPGAYFAAEYCSYPVASLESDRLTMPATLLPGVELS